MYPSLLQSVQTPPQQLYEINQLNTEMSLTNNYPQSYDELLKNNSRDTESSLIHQQLHQQMYQHVLNNTMTNRERRIHHRLIEKQYNQERKRTRIGGHDLLISTMESDLIDAKRQREALLKQKELEANVGCDNNGFVNYTENSILSTNKNKYSMMSELGRGTFSRVFRCKKMNDIEKKEYAIKVTRNVKKYQLAAMNELTILKHITANDTENTSGCIHIVDCGVYYEHPMFVFPLLSVSLRSFMKIAPHKPSFDVEQVTHLMWQLCRGITFIHSLRIINTDLKPDNIMLVSDEVEEGNETKLKSTEIKIIDFGLAVMQKENKKYHHSISTSQYRAPEVILGLDWSFGADIWSLGCILVELIYGKLLFPTRSNIKHLQQITQCIGTPPNHYLPAIREKVGDMDINTKYKPLSAYFLNGNEECAQLYDLCSKMLCWNPMERITAQAALQHPAFCKYK